MKKFAIEIKWAIRYIFVFLAWVFLEKYTGAYADNIDYYFLYSFLFYILAFLIYLLALREKRTEYFGGQMDWRQGVVSGMYMTVFAAILMPFAQIVIHKAIAPEFFPNMIKRALSAKNAKPDAVRAYFSFPGYIWQSVFLTLSVGMVYAAAASRVIRNKTKNQK